VPLIFGCFHDQYSSQWCLSDVLVQKLYHCSLHTKQQQFCTDQCTTLLAHKVLETIHPLIGTTYNYFCDTISFTSSWMDAILDNQNNWLVWWQIIMYYLQDSQTIHRRTMQQTRLFRSCEVALVEQHVQRLAVISLNWLSYCYMVCGILAAGNPGCLSPCMEPFWRVLTLGIGGVRNRQADKPTDWWM